MFAPSKNIPYKTNMYIYHKHYDIDEIIILEFFLPGQKHIKNIY